MYSIDDVLTDQNFLLYCAKHYDNVHCHSTEEFNDDVRRIKYVKKLLTRYMKTGDLQEHLILNHIVTIMNLFGVEHGIRILFLKLGDRLHLLKPFLVFMDILPDAVYGVGNLTPINTDGIKMDIKIVDALRSIKKGSSTNAEAIVQPTNK